MVMWKFKSCPRCGGDFFIDKDGDGWYKQCLQCGFRQELKPLETPEQQAELAMIERSHRKRHARSQTDREQKHKANQPKT